MTAKEIVSEIVALAKERPLVGAGDVVMCGNNDPRDTILAHSTRRGCYHIIEVDSCDIQDDRKIPLTGKVMSTSAPMSLENAAILLTICKELCFDWNVAVVRRDKTFNSLGYWSIFEDAALVTPLPTLIDIFCSAQST
jgi:hypothetical protein